MNDRVLSTEEIEALGNGIAETAAMIDVATHRFLTQLRDFDRVGGWHRGGFLSCAHWLSWRVGMTLRAAREQVRVARRLAELPLIDGALCRGEVSYSKVRAMTRIATSANEADLLKMATKTTGSQLEKICRLKRSENRLDTSAAREQEECGRYVVQHSTDDGMVSTQVRLHPEEAARFIRALEVLGGRDLADGAVALADLALSGAAAAMPDQHGADDGRDAAGDSRQDAPGDSGHDTSGDGAPSLRRTVRSPTEVLVHISAADLEGVTELGDGLAPDTCRRLLCDGGVVAILEDDSGRIIDVGRRTRVISAALRRALEARDGGCRFPGCTNRRFVDGHHIVHWSDGGETSLDNTVLLCRRHHRYLHECGFTVAREGDDFVFRDPAGTIIRPQAERPAVRQDFADFMSGWLDRSNTPWREPPGSIRERIDYARCVSALRQGQADRASGAGG